MLGRKSKICVLISGGGTNLQALLDAEKENRIKSGEIVLVASDNPSAYGLTRAKNSLKETYILNNEADFITELESKQIDMIVLAGFLKILSPEIVKLYENRIINIHPSLIPSFCGKGCYGLHVHERALEYGVKITGATVHFVNEITDGGKIISQKAVEVLENDTPEILQRRVMEEAEWILLPKATEDLAFKIKEGLI
ncbi:phosphoribosylglycinamide formyltransferase [Eubacterium nodatum ATCC 33099]|nr:phosphoribosylglycinamide formyltransferase [Eubacterium nodatum ATCC 33099]